MIVSPCGADLATSMASSLTENPTDNDRLVFKRQRWPPFPVWGQQRCFYARETSLLSRAPDGAMSPFRVKQPGAYLEHFCSWRYAQTTTTTSSQKTARRIGCSSYVAELEFPYISRLVTEEAEVWIILDIHLSGNWLKGSHNVQHNSITTKGL